MSIDALTLLAIAGMAVATYTTRGAGLFLIQLVSGRGRVHAAFD